MRLANRALSTIGANASEWEVHDDGRKRSCRSVVNSVSVVECKFDENPTGLLLAGSFVREKRVDAGVVSMVSNRVIKRCTAVASGSSSRYYFIVVVHFGGQNSQPCVKCTYKPRCAAVEIKKIMSFTIFNICAVRQHSVSLIRT